MRLRLLVVAVAGLVLAGSLAASAQRAPLPLPSPRRTLSESAPRQLNGVYTVDQALRGQVLYRKACAYCHMEELTGGGPQDSLITSPPLVGPNFRSYWVGRPLEHLVTKIATTMPKYSPGSLSRQEAVDLLAYILWESNFPDGATELPADSDELESIPFTEYK